MSQANNLFSNSALKFESVNVNVERVPIPINEAKFGILNLKAISSPLSQEEHDFIFMVDCSGSMSDSCSDGRSKMQHIIHTLKNMILYFREHPAIKAHITVDSFDDNIYKIVERCEVNDSNFAEIIAKIDKIMPKASTNIEEALKSIKNTAAEIQSMYPQNNIVNIFMTDGEPTSGNTRASDLANLVNRNITNSFIGFGMQHDATLLNTVANGQNSAYYFIDKLENSGLVYGEVLHGIVYKLLKNVQISLQNGYIYDFKNNTWINEINIGQIVSEADKIYHIISDKPEECIVNLTAIKNSDNSEFSAIIIKQEESEDLTRYIYRQRTLQHLAIVSDFLKRKNEYNINNQFGIFMVSQLPNNDLKEEETLIRENLKKFIEEMKAYMAENNLNDDKFMKNLCDDIYISYRTFGTVYAAMYNNARQTSQGTQRCYTVSQTPDVSDTTVDLFSSGPSIPRLNRNLNRNRNARVPPMPRLQRSTNNQAYDFPDFPDDLNHVVSDFADTPYLTPTSTQVMREISCSTDVYNSIGELDEEEEQETQQIN